MPPLTILPRDGAYTACVTVDGRTVECGHRHKSALAALRCGRDLLHLAELRARSLAQQGKLFAR
jgi:hypothetical protein